MFVYGRGLAEFAACSIATPSEITNTPTTPPAVLSTSLSPPGAVATASTPPPLPPPLDTPDLSVPSTPELSNPSPVSSPTVRKTVVVLPSATTSTLSEYTGAADREAIRIRHSALVGIAGLILAWL
ncbi:hypothetical protein EJ02DRAFT_194958 [Clathrospora elynae]|uniref:Uncharacterized protein n=1 Tax=Clathrospora elynae TaxID=706981 RepID=A0A6A5SPM6_9PLEO|nr:hypothetical protein EJ02DRAFT_194958 [Clathrospora elynae]